MLVIRVRDRFINRRYLDNYNCGNQIFPRIQARSPQFSLLANFPIEVKPQETNNMQQASA
jgi:hypothetical protein